VAGKLMSEKLIGLQDNAESANMIEEGLT